MSPLNLKIIYCAGQDPMEKVATLTFKIDCPDGKTRGRGIHLKSANELIDLKDLLVLVESINATWKEYSHVAA